MEKVKWFGMLLIIVCIVISIYSKQQQDLLPASFSHVNRFLLDGVKEVSNFHQQLHSAILGPALSTVDSLITLKRNGTTQMNDLMYVTSTTGKQLLSRQPHKNDVIYVTSTTRKQLLTEQPHMQLSPTKNSSVSNKTDTLQLASEFSKLKNVTCEPMSNLMFVKTHKTASTTLQSVLNRFGYFNNLSMVFMKNNKMNGHVRYIKLDLSSPQKLFVPPLNFLKHPSFTHRYNMSTGHIRYNRKVMDSFMGSRTKYITILREPSSQWISAFHHLGLGGRFRRSNKTFSNISEVELVAHFMTAPESNLQKDKGSKAYFKNNQFFDLGLPGGYDEALVRENIDILDKEMDLVLIVDYFDESLILLKKLMCWSYEHILYVPKNQVPIHETFNNTLREKIRKFNYADALLYAHFNKTFWRKVKEYGSTFNADLATFRKMQNETFTRCTEKSEIIKAGNFQHLEYLPAKNGDIFCTTLAENHNVLFKRLFNRQLAQ